MVPWVTGALMVIVVSVTLSLVSAVFDTHRDILQTGNTVDGLSMPDEKRLIRHLLQVYERAGVVGRPVFNTSKVLDVRFGITLIQIIDLNERDQILTLNVWNNYEWHDDLLQWTPSEFGGVESIRVPPSLIWTPDIVLFNYADVRLKEQREALVVVSSNGDIMWMPTAIYRSTCTIDIVHFPFDEQKCELKFGSWTFDSSRMDINFLAQHNKSILITDAYTPSKEWHLLEYPGRKDNETRHGADFPHLIFSLRILRRPLTYTYLLIIPCVLLSVLNLVIFWLPPEAPAKMMLGIMIFVAFFVLLQLLASLTPPTGQDIPLIGLYFCMNMVLITISTFIAVFILYLYFRGDRKNRMPEFIRTVVLYRLATVLCMHNMLEKTGGGLGSSSSAHKMMDISASKVKLKVKVHQHGDSEPSNNSFPGGRRATAALTLTGNSRPPTVLDLRPIAARAELQVAAAITDRSPMAVGMTLSRGLESDVKEVKRLIRSYVARLSEKERTMVAAKEWRNLSRVVDRLFFYIYLAAIIVSLVAIFPREKLSSDSPQPVGT